MSFCGKIIKNLSGKRDSDPRPQPWQGCALPTELFPQQINIFLKVKRRRLELPRHNCHYPLKVARLPIPPPLQLFKNILNKNVPRTGLEPARRETHAPETCASTNSATWAFLVEAMRLVCYSECVSGKRDSDPRPQPWQGCALPTELFPQDFLFLRSISLDCGCKGSTFF